MNQVCQDDFSEVSFSVREWNMMVVACDILQPFTKATYLTQSDKAVTISFVVQTVLDLYGHLNRSQAKSRYCHSLSNALQNSLEIRSLEFLKRVKCLIHFVAKLLHFLKTFSLWLLYWIQYLLAIR